MGETGKNRIWDGMYTPSGLWRWVKRATRGQTNTYKMKHGRDSSSDGGDRDAKRPKIDGTVFEPCEDEDVRAHIERAWKRAMAVIREDALRSLDNEVGDVDLRHEDPSCDADGLFDTVAGAICPDTPYMYTFLGDKLRRLLALYGFSVRPCEVGFNNPLCDRGDPPTYMSWSSVFVCGRCLEHYPDDTGEQSSELRERVLLPLLSMLDDAEPLAKRACFVAQLAAAEC